MMIGMNSNESDYFNKEGDPQFLYFGSPDIISVEKLQEEMENNPDFSFTAYSYYYAGVSQAFETLAKEKNPSFNITFNDKIVPYWNNVESSGLDDNDKAYLYIFDKSDIFKLVEGSDIAYVTKEVPNLRKVKEMVYKDYKVYFERTSNNKTR